MRDLRVLCIVTLGHFTVMGIFLAALPLYVTDRLGGSRAAVGVAVGSFFVSALLFRPPVGRALDTWGRKPFLVAAPALIAVTSFGLLAASTLPVVVALRFLQGFGGATFYIAAVTIATDLAPEERRAEVITVFSLFLYGGIAAGPALGEYLVRGDAFGRAWMTAGVLALAATLIATFLPETTGRSERRKRPLRFLHPASISPGLVLLFAATGYASITSFSPIYARSIGLDNSGGLYAVFALSILAVRLATRKMADRKGRIAVAFPGTVAAALGMASMAIAEPFTAYLGAALFAAGFALIFPALMALVADRASDAERGEALGSFTAFFDVGAGAGTYAFGALAGAFGFRFAFAMPTVLCVMGIYVLMRLRRSARAGHLGFPDGSAVR